MRDGVDGANQGEPRKSPAKKKRPQNRHGSTKKGPGTSKKKGGPGKSRPKNTSLRGGGGPGPEHKHVVKKNEIKLPEQELGQADEALNQKKKKKRTHEAQTSRKKKPGPRQEVEKRSRKLRGRWRKSTLQTTHQKAQTIGTTKKIEGSDKHRGEKPSTPPKASFRFWGCQVNGVGTMVGDCLKRKRKKGTSIKEIQE